MLSAAVGKVLISLFIPRTGCDKIKQLLFGSALTSFKPCVLFMDHMQTVYRPRYDTAERGVPSGAILFD